jgi:hypothetical protein
LQGGDLPFTDVLSGDLVAQIRQPITAKWAGDKAMKFVRVGAVKLTHIGHDGYHGEVEWHMEQYTSTVPIHVVGVHGQPLERKIAAPGDMPLKVETYVAFQVFCEWPITDDQAGRFVGWFDEHGHIGNDAGSVLLRKDGPAFVLHMPMHDGIPADAEMVKLAVGIAKGLSADVFVVSPVDVHLCDQQLRTIKIVKSR